MWKIKVEGVSGFLDWVRAYDNFYDALTWVRNTFSDSINFTLDENGDLVSDQIAYSGQPFVRIIFS